MLRLLLVACLVLTLTPPLQAQPADFSALVEGTSQAVVNISITRKASSADGNESLNLGELPGEMQDFFKRFLNPHKDGPESKRRSQGLGSGFIISNDGYILTAAHVVKDAETVTVRSADRREWEAKVVGSDRYSDVALLKVEAKNLPVARIGNSDSLKVGQWVLAIGQPFGLDFTATAGIVSALGRNLPKDTYVPFIQTDVALNPGNSGGPLYDMDGQVVGISAQIYSPSGGYAGLSFAVPINTAMEAVEQLKTTGQVVRGWLGITIQPVNQELAHSFGLDRPRGALIAQITEDGPAQRGGLQVGDVIVSFQNQPVPTSADLPPLVGRARPGSTVPLVVIRDGREQTLSLSVGELPKELLEPAAKGADKANGSKKKNSDDKVLGMTLVPAPDRQEGVLVKRVEAGPGQEARLQAGDVILQLAGTPVKDVEQFRTLVRKLAVGRTVPLLVQRNGNPHFFALKVPD